MAFAMIFANSSSLGQLGAGDLGPPQFAGLEVGAKARHKGEVRLQKARALCFKAWLADINRLYIDINHMGSRSYIICDRDIKPILSL